MLDTLRLLVLGQLRVDLLEEGVVDVVAGKTAENACESIEPVVPDRGMSCDETSHGTMNHTAHADVRECLE